MSFLHHWRHVHGAHTQKSRDALWNRWRLLLTSCWWSHDRWLATPVQCHTWWRSEFYRRPSVKWITVNLRLVQRRRWGFKSAGLWRCFGVPLRFDWSYCLQLYWSSTEFPHEIFLNSLSFDDRGIRSLRSTVRYSPKVTGSGEPLSQDFKVLFL